MSEQLQDDVLSQIMGELTRLREEVASQKAEIARLKAAPTSVEVISEGKPHHNRSLTTSRRRLLGKLAAGALVAGFAGTTTLASQPAQAKMVSSQFASTAAFTNLGGLAILPGTSYTNTPPSVYNYGLAAFPDASSSIDLSTLPQATVGIYGQSNNIGVYGKSVVSSGIGVYGIVDGGVGVQGTGNQGGTGVGGTSDSGTGVSGITNNGTGVHGSGSIGVSAYTNISGGTGLNATAASSGYAVTAVANVDYGVYAHGAKGSLYADGTISLFSGTKIGLDIQTATNGLPLRINPVSSAPTTGVTTGAIYVNTSGNLFVYNGTAWKQVQYL